ncbi:hypothetical protein BS47DRAFT_1302447 [Hydnum rufescens UP504]|uniref:Uncharacterized protein n=1 Tax=Hydnum rufescens UP504 TaxID=1448309 RepID=A0A9P6AN21_9AGAM|nr:hypothetical protein BS47DRAFT_1302447 [Hydnum rufescens UP504]
MGADNVSCLILWLTLVVPTVIITIIPGEVVYILKDHVHWVTTLALNTDFILHTSPYDHMGKVPTSDEEGKSSYC